MRIWLASFFILFLSLPSIAVDKRVPIGINPYKKSSVQIIIANSGGKSSQYKTANEQLTNVSVSKNNIGKLIYRTTRFDKLEFGLEGLYYFKRYQQKQPPNGNDSVQKDSIGFGDTALSATYEIANRQKSQFGLIAGIELKLPTGNESEGLGSSSTDYIFRTAVSKQTRIGVPYFSAIYTITGNGNIDGISTDAGDDLYLALGFKTPMNKKIFADARLFRTIYTEDQIKASGDQQAVTKKYSTNGLYASLNFRQNKNSVYTVFAEFTEDYNAETEIGGNTFRLEHTEKFKAGIKIKFFW